MLYTALITAEKKGKKMKGIVLALAVVMCLAGCKEIKIIKVDTPVRHDVKCPACGRNDKYPIYYSFDGHKFKIDTADKNSVHKVTLVK